MQIAAEHPETIRLFTIPRIIGNSPLFATLLNLISSFDCVWACSISAFATHFLAHPEYSVRQQRNILRFLPKCQILDTL